MKLSQLHPNEGQINGVPNNPRKITQAEFEKLKKSIFESREFLVERPIVVDEGWNILGGNMRYRACCELRDAHARNGAFEFSDEIPDEWVKQVQWTRKKKREFVAKDNKSSGETDAALLAAWDDGELCDWGIIDDKEQKPDTDTDAWDDDEEQKPQPAVQFQTFETVKQKRKQLWGKDYKSEVVTDLKEEFLCHYLHGGGFSQYTDVTKAATSWKT